MILYHGSNMQINVIDLSRCNRFKDFGQAFYLSADKNQAEEIAQTRADFLGGEPVVSSFEFDERLLATGVLKSNTSPIMALSGHSLYGTTGTRNALSFSRTIMI